MRCLKTLLREQGGATAIEYALIAGVICTVIVLALTEVGTSLNAIFVNVAAGF